MDLAAVDGASCPIFYRCIPVTSVAVFVLFVPFSCISGQLVTWVSIMADNEANSNQKPHLQNMIQIMVHDKGKHYLI